MCQSMRQTWFKLQKLSICSWNEQGGIEAINAGIGLKLFGVNSIEQNFMDRKFSK